MSPNRSCRRRAAVGAIVCCCALIAPAAFAQSEFLPPSYLSGLVYLDVNENGYPDPADWGICGATVTLIKQGDGSFSPFSVYTTSYGSYLFDGASASNHGGLPEGTYTIRLDTTSAMHGVQGLGTLWDLQTNLPLPFAQQTSYQGTTSDNGLQNQSFTDIYLPLGTAGTGYDFGEGIYPIQLVSKRMILTTNDVQHVTVPEPGMLALLAVGGITWAVAGLRRRCRARAV